MKTFIRIGLILIGIFAIIALSLSWFDRKSDQNYFHKNYPDIESCVISNIALGMEKFDAADLCILLEQASPEQIKELQKQGLID